MTNPPVPGPPWQPPAPYHPKAIPAVVLGGVALVGGMFCYLPILCAPFAWAIGHRAVREIRASPEAWRGSTEAEIGRILGMVGTILLAISVVLVVVWLAWVYLAVGPAFF